jgi:hypothetical protein
LRRVRGLSSSRRSPGEAGVRHRGVVPWGARLRNADFWPGVRSARSWFEGEWANRKARRRARTARGQTEIGAAGVRQFSEGPARRNEKRNRSVKNWRSHGAGGLACLAGFRQWNGVKWRSQPAERFAGRLRNVATWNEGNSGKSGPLRWGPGNGREFRGGLPRPSERNRKRQSSVTCDACPARFAWGRLGFWRFR